MVDAFGANLNWSAEVADRVATLAPVAGQGLSFETAYAVEIDVRDAAGNRSQLRIVFVTNLIKK